MWTFTVSIHILGSVLGKNYNLVTYSYLIKFCFLTESKECVTCLHVIMTTLCPHKGAKKIGEQNNNKF